MATVVRIRVNSRLTLAWIRLIKTAAPVLVPLIGADRTFRIGAWGAERLMLVDFGRGWQRLRS